MAGMDDLVDLDTVNGFFEDLSETLLSISDESQMDSARILIFLDQAVKCRNFLLLLSNRMVTSRPLLLELINRVDIYIERANRKKRGMDERLAIYRTEAQVTVTGQCGRPKYHISEETLLYFRGLGFSWKAISALLLVSRWTIYRRVREFVIADLTGFTNITDDELDNVILGFRQQHGIAIGRSITIGHLRSIGIRVQQRRVTSSLQRIDPDGSRLRWRILIKRRKYSVPGPNSLWHIDGHHSLVNWGFVIHGCIDGYSRHIMYLQCSTNNRSQTVIELFNRAFERYGTPSRLRSDRGGENVLVWERMVQLRGEGRGSYIAGSSVHNQRIERLWSDVWNYVASDFYYVFQSLEEQGLLYRENARHMFLLHYIYLPRINQVIDGFVEGWNRHPLRSERNWTPKQLWVNGMMDQRNRQLLQVRELHEIESVSSEDFDMFGVDWHAPSPTDDNVPFVEVVDVENPFENDFFLEINPLADSAYFGMDLYVDALSRSN